MAKPVIMPKFGFTQEESTIVAWLRQEGDRVEKGDPILEATTDKINMEVEAPESGVLGGIQYPAGAVVPVTAIIAYILSEGESLPAQPAESAAAAATAGPAPATPVAKKMAEAAGIDLRQVPGTGPGGKIVRDDVARYASRSVPTAGGGSVAPLGSVRATPAARRVARERDVNLAGVTGSGPRGRIQQSDVEAAAARPAPEAQSLVAAPRLLSYEPGEPAVIPLEGMRKTIAERMQASAQQAPHVMFTLDIDMTRAIALREQANRQLPPDASPISLSAVIIKACAWALKQNPRLNSYLYGDQILVLPYINIGMAVALEEGLIVPVIHEADRKGLAQIGAEVADLAARAREGRLRPEEVADGTFTVSNLGMFGIDHFTAIINPPQVGILAVGRTVKRLVVDENDQPAVRPRMTVTLSTDHRVVDGAQSARFVTTLRTALEDPMTMLV